MSDKDSIADCYDDEDFVYEDDDGLQPSYSHDIDIALDDHLQQFDKGYQILTGLQVISEQSDELDRITSVCELSQAWARVLLRAYGWNVERLLNDVFDKGTEQILKANGIDAKSACILHKVVECGTCFDDVAPQEAFGLSCGHIFCKDCWTTYITGKVTEGQARNLHCMGFKCKLKLDDAVILSFVDAATKQKFTRALVESYVDDNEHVKWCPSVPHCGNCVRITAVGKVGDIQCTCGASFCFSCQKEVHSPATCIMATKWVEKCKDDSETANWMKANTKPCPKCGQNIEKNGGCNYVYCSKCQYDFCWTCLYLCPKGQSHTAHDCNKYQQSDSESSSADAKHILERYLFYYNRWKSHDDSTKFDMVLRTKIAEKAQLIWNAQASELGRGQVEAINEAMEVLFTCRHILRNSYVLAFYLFDCVATLTDRSFLPNALQRLFPAATPAEKSTITRTSSTRSTNNTARGTGRRTTKKAKVIPRQKAPEHTYLPAQKRNELKRLQNLFEDNQQQLENTTEKLAWWLERSPSEFISSTNRDAARDLHTAATVAEKRLEALFTTVHADILDGDVGVVPPFHKAQPFPYHKNYTAAELRKLQKNITYIEDTSTRANPFSNEGDAAVGVEKGRKGNEEQQFHDDMAKALLLSAKDKTPSNAVDAGDDDPVLRAAIAASLGAF